MTAPNGSYPQLTQEDFSELVDRRQEAVAALDDIDGSVSLFASARAYLVEACSHVPCQYIGEVDDITHAGVRYTHNCRDHGYDLSDQQSWILPVEYITNPDGWRTRHEQEAAKISKLVAAEKRAAEEREYQRLKAVYEPE